MTQVESICSLMSTALDQYDLISENTKIKMHGRKPAEIRINAIKADFDHFQTSSRKQSRQAQERESITTQPKEKISQGQKARITIRNYLKGVYYMTADEAIVRNCTLYLTEAKHTSKGTFPSRNDILDGCFKMVLFSNLDGATIGRKRYRTRAVLRLTNVSCIDVSVLTGKDKLLYEGIQAEAKKNRFIVQIG